MQFNAPLFQAEGVYWYSSDPGFYDNFRYNTKAATSSIYTHLSSTTNYLLSMRTYFLFSYYELILDNKINKNYYYKQSKTWENFYYCSRIHRQISLAFMNCIYLFPIQQMNTWIFISTVSIRKYCPFHCSEKAFMSMPLTCWPKCMDCDSLC